MAASNYAYYDTERGERGYWINEGRTWVSDPGGSTHPDAWQVD